MSRSDRLVADTSLSVPAGSTRRIGGLPCPPVGAFPASSGGPRDRRWAADLEAFLAGHGCPSGIWPRRRDPCRRRTARCAARRCCCRRPPGPRSSGRRRGRRRRRASRMWWPWCTGPARAAPTPPRAGPGRGGSVPWAPSWSRGRARRRRSRPCARRSDAGTSTRSTSSATRGARTWATRCRRCAGSAACPAPATAACCGGAGWAVGVRVAGDAGGGARRHACAPGRSRAPGRPPRRGRAELLASPKERAEHIMIVDLERNDLARVARTGTRAGGAAVRGARVGRPVAGRVGGGRPTLRARHRPGRRCCARCARAGR